jgi:hypothetical protein
MAPVRMGLDEGDGTRVTEGLEEDLRQGLKRLNKKAETVLDAEGYSRIISALRGGSPDTSAPSLTRALSQAFGGLGDAFGALGKGYKEVFEQLTSGSAKGQTGDNNLLVVMLGIMSMLMQQMQAQLASADERWAAVLTVEREHHKRYTEDLHKRLHDAQQPSQWDSLAMQTAQTIFQSQLERVTKTSSPLEELDHHAETLDKLLSVADKVRGRRGGEPPEYSPGAIEWQRLQNEAQRDTHLHDQKIAAERTKQTMWAAVRERGPEIVSQAIGEIVGGIAAFAPGRGGVPAQ